MRQRLDDASLHNPRLVEGVKGNVVAMVLGATITLSSPLQRIYALDANGAGRTVIMPDEATCKGQECYIINTAAGAFGLTIKNSLNNATVGQIDQNEGAIAVCDGTRWKIMVNAET